MKIITLPKHEVVSTLFKAKEVRHQQLMPGIAEFILNGILQILWTTTFWFVKYRYLPCGQDSESLSLIRIAVNTSGLSHLYSLAEKELASTLFTAEKLGNQQLIYKAHIEAQQLLAHFPRFISLCPLDMFTAWRIQTQKKK